MSLTNRLDKEMGRLYEWAVRMHDNSLLSEKEESCESYFVKSPEGVDIEEYGFDNLMDLAAKLEKMWKKTALEELSTVCAVAAYKSRYTGKRHVGSQAEKESKDKTDESDKILDFIYEF